MVERREALPLRFAGFCFTAGGETTGSALRDVAEPRRGVLKSVNDDPAEFFFILDLTAPFVGMRAGLEGDAGDNGPGPAAFGLVTVATSPSEGLE